MSETNLIGSFGSLEQAQEQISKYFYSDITLVQSACPVWEIHNSNGHIKGVQLIKKKNRYRFIRIEKEV